MCSRIHWLQLHEWHQRVCIRPMCARNLCCKSSPYCCPSHTCGCTHTHFCITHALTHVLAVVHLNFYFRSYSTATAAHVRQATLAETVILTLLWQTNLAVSIHTWINASVWNGLFGFDVLSDYLHNLKLLASERIHPCHFHFLWSTRESYSHCWWSSACDGSVHDLGCDWHYHCCSCEKEL